MTALLIISAFSILTAWAYAFAQGKDQARYVGRLHDEHNRERELWHRERQLLLNRIKPETAQYVPDGQPVVTPPALRFDDDEQYWTQVPDMSTEDLAAAMMAQELQGRDG